MLFRLPWRKKDHPAFCDTQQASLDDLIGEFMSAIGDIRSPAQARLYAAIISCRTPKDLWFLRAKMFNLIAQQYSQAEAHQRLQGLDSKLQFFVDHHDEYTADELPSRPGALTH